MKSTKISLRRWLCHESLFTERRHVAPKSWDNRKNGDCLRNIRITTTVIDQYNEEKIKNKLREIISDRENKDNIKKYIKVIRILEIN